VSTKMACELSVYGSDLEPDEVTRLLGIQPDTTWRRGDPRGSRRTAFFDYGCWRIETGIAEEADMNEQLKVLLARLGTHEETLKAMRPPFDLEFGCVIYLDGPLPILHVDADTLQRISHLGAELDIDLYQFPHVSP